jgi:hypothetical protein
VPIGLVQKHAPPQPNDLLNAEIAAQLFLYVGASEVWIAVGIQQTLFGGKTSALPIHMNRAALQNEGRPVAIRGFELEHLVRDLIVAIPRKVQSALKAAPGVECPIDTPAPTLGIDDECGPDIPHPGIVTRELEHANFARQSGSGVLKLRCGNPYRDRLTSDNSCCHRRKDSLRRLSALAPVVGTFRPQHPAAAVPFELGGHAEAVFRGG